VQVFAFLYMHAEVIPLKSNEANYMRNLNFCCFCFRIYYRCNHVKLYACRVKKKVQLLGDHPNIFEVRYNGGHTCRMSLTIPSLFVPSRQPLDISMDVTQTTMPTSSTLYSGWISSGIPGIFYGKNNFYHQ